MKVGLQKVYWKDILASLKAMRVMAHYCVDQDKGFCKDLDKRLITIICEIERQMKLEEEAKEEPK